MKHFDLVTVVIFFTSLITSVHSVPTPNVTSAAVLTATVTAVPGVLYPPTEASEELGEANEVPAPPVPTADFDGPYFPTINVTTYPSSASNSSATRRSKRATCPHAPGVPFSASNEFDGRPEFNPTEPSGAQHGRFIFTTSNTFAAFSLNGGADFTSLDPSVYAGPANPPIHNGLCCDQVVQYIPQVDNFVWLMQYFNADRGNMLRLVTFCPKDLHHVRGITKFSTLDLTSETFGLADGVWMDYPDMAVGDDFLYVSVDAVGVGLFVIRIPFSVLKEGGAIRFTPPELGVTAYGGHISQNARDTLYWAGHSLFGAEMQVFWWPPGDFFFWQFLAVDPWPVGPFVSLCPGGVNWLEFGSGFPWSAVIGATRRTRTEVWFAWTAAGVGGGGFLSEPHVQVVQIDTGGATLAIIDQWQIWNPTIAYAYPALATNDCEEVGLAVAFGGGGFFASGAVAITTGRGLTTVWYDFLSTACASRFGDYFTIRESSPDATLFDAFMYTASEPTPGFLDLRQEWILF